LEFYPGRKGTTQNIGGSPAILEPRKKTEKGKRAAQQLPDRYGQDTIILYQRRTWEPWERLEFEHEEGRDNEKTGVRGAAMDSEEKEGGGKKSRRRKYVDLMNEGGNF